MEIHKEDLLDEISEETDLSREDAEEVLEQFITRTRDSLQGGKKVKIPGLGELYTAKQRVTPLKEKTVIKFQPDKQLMKDN